MLLMMMLLMEILVMVTMALPDLLDGMISISTLARKPMVP